LPGATKFVEVDALIDLYERDYEKEIKEYENVIQEKKYESQPKRKNIYLRRAIGKEVLEPIYMN